MTNDGGHEESSVQPRRRRPSALALRLLVTAGGLALWFWTQSLIGARALPDGGVGDGLHTLTASLNDYLNAHPTATNALLIASSAIIDLLGVVLLAKWIFGNTVRPFLGLVILLGLRQLMQALVALPAPPNVIWHHPGFPSLLVTYGVATDYFFSGHTAIAVLGATELTRLHRRWLTTVAWLVAIFEMATVLTLRAHYTMDVFAGLTTALCAAHLAERLAPAIDRALAPR
jgi:membrane-associated phospholipid phosphatase